MSVGGASRDGGGEGLKARVAVMVRGRLRGGDARAPSFMFRVSRSAETKKADMNGNGNGNENMNSKENTNGKMGKSTRARRIMGHFKKGNDQQMNCNEKRWRKPGKVATLRLRFNLFISKVRDVGSDAMGWVGVLIMDFLGKISKMGEGVKRRMGGGKKEKKVRFSRRSFF